MKVKAVTSIGELEAVLDQHMLGKTLKPDERWRRIVVLIVTKLDSGGFSLCFSLSGRRLTYGWMTLKPSMTENGVDGRAEGGR